MNQSDKKNDFQSMYREIREQQNEAKDNFMRQHYDKLPSWSRQEMDSGVLGSQHATSGSALNQVTCIELH
ncbi:hypothetical protein GCK72_025750 [Caenorhabditis remanei]|uniref:Uncharacterized protein n=1 Tax=Caenorhabditis remanei TaxID=31234 RepID=A0A6A5G3A0_CAERE|nr:hypothetical protein GCK72_025750 [Caenorhabditis remanei]KAF1749283.1 hypothetical protein GCK72_025750 [Caenorhabditis remanei]